ncbi:hypothetical protein C8Q80DRAFT_1171575 [Daedaleopsis nitida]|nr:hypothetical protein C8Q80DRAFT_1171575 [Daedaleopsis nitida]
MLCTTTTMHAASPSYLLRQFIVAPRRCTRPDLPRSLSTLVASAHSTASRRSLGPPASATTATPCSARPRRDRRPFASSAPACAATAQKLKAHKADLVAYPTPAAGREEAEADEDEPELELVGPEEAVLGMTDRAAEQLRAIAQREQNPGAALRVAVESGGCHGYQYKMELAKGREADDYHFSHPRIKPSNIYVDAVSMTLLKGSSIDYATELIGSSFRVLDNPQAKGSGCGCGVSWELKEL